MANRKTYKKVVRQIPEAVELKNEIITIYGWWVKIISSTHVRISDGDKAIDFFSKKYHKLGSNERGVIPKKYLAFLEDYFIYQ